MPCNCSGVRYEKCKCRVLDPHYQLPVTRSRVMILAHEQNSCCAHDPDKNAKRGLFTRALESVYERCAGYNLRYCSMRGLHTKNCMRETLRDALLLVCFLLANAVVFLTIFTRMTLHAATLVLQYVCWLRRSPAGSEGEARRAALPPAATWRSSRG